jgi:hypothetical protein
MTKQSFEIETAKEFFIFFTIALVVCCFIF